MLSLVALLRLCRALSRDERGNIAILFAASVIPLILLMGGAVDVVRFARYKAELANAVDAAALALARIGQEYTEEQATEFVEDYVAALQVGDAQFNVQGFDVDKTGNGYIVTATGAMNTVFLPLGKMAKNGSPIMSMGMNIVAEVVHSSNQVELALVLDNTGSMNCGSTVSSSCTGNWSNPGSSSRIAGLKSAAHKLVDVLIPDGAESPEFIKIGIVPFEGTVNIGSTYAANPPSWVDWSDQAKAKYTGQNFGKYNFSTNSACSTGSSCKFVGHKWLFNRLAQDNSSVKWEGCMEMRAEPYDILDTVPTASTPDTLFVPFFWPDEPDWNNDDGDNYQNDYLDDITSSNGSAAQKYIQKYYNSNIDWQGSADTSFPFTSGPNYGCPRPILALTNSKTNVENAIDSMVAYPAMGTFIPNGLVWGWHILSSTEPFTEGIAPADEDFDKTVKAIVLLSDGENSVTGTNNHNKSIFSGYNYTGLQVGGSYRLGSSSASTATTNLNTRTSTLCTNVKAAGIRLYTITFGDIPSAAQTLMRNCASVDDGERLYYHAPSNSELENIFSAIGKDLSEIHLSM